MKQLLAAILVFAVVALFPAFVLSETCPPVDEPTQAWWMVLLDFLVQLSAPLVTTILGVLGTWVARKLTRKWEAEKQESLARLMEGTLMAGVAYAEEQARKACRAGGIRTEGTAKLQTALDFVRMQWGQSGLPEIAEGELRQLIESRVQRERARPDGVIPSDPPCADQTSRPLLEG